VTLELFSFVFLGVLAIISGLILLTREQPVSAAMGLILMFIMFAGMYGIMDAHFAAIAQLIVYAGAIMVVFVFVIMLLNIPMNELQLGRLSILEWGLVFLAVTSSLVLGTEAGKGMISGASQLVPHHLSGMYFPPQENLKNVAGLMFTKYLWAFELISLLILVATVGAVVAGKKRVEND
jgi:NADH-quinone oxidoreductase subunit J